MAAIKLAYGSSVAYTITLASLASSSGLTGGQESNSVDNTANLYIDYLIGGKITTGTSPTVGRIEVWAAGSLDDTPTYPDVLDGTGSAETMTTADIKVASLKWLATMVTDTTSNRTYWFGPVSLASVFGGTLPKFHVLFVTHNTAVALNGTGGNHAISYTPTYYTVA